MEKSNHTKHEFENAVLTVQRLAKSIQPAMSRVIAYVETKETEVVSSRELEILKESMGMLEEETDKLLQLSDKIFKNQRG